MRLTLTGRQVETTPQIRQLVESRLAKIERRFGAVAVSAQLVLSREKNRYVAELTVHARGDHMLHGLGSAASWSTALTAAVQKVIQQADKVKGKWQERKRAASGLKRGAAPRRRR